MNKTKLNFNVPLLGLDNKPAADVKLNVLLSNTLAQSQEQDPVKYFDWAIVLFNEGILELDNADVETITKFIKGNQNLMTLAKGRLLEVITEAQKAKK